MSEETATAASTDGNTARSNRMATLVPTFDPSKDDLEQYTQKVELLSEIWPATKINELITRLILNTNGTAFQKLQLNKSQLMTNDKKGVQQLVQLLGGQWGKSIWRKSMTSWREHFSVAFRNKMNPTILS